MKDEISLEIIANNETIQVMMMTKVQAYTQTDLVTSGIYVN